MADSSLGGKGKTEKKKKKKRTKNKQMNRQTHKFKKKKKRNRAQKARETGGKVYKGNVTKHNKEEPSPHVKYYIWDG